MNKLIMALLLLALAACSQREAVESYPPMSANADVAESSRIAKVQGGAEQSLTRASEPAQQAADSEAKKYIALRHHLSVETEAESMQASFDATIAHCEALNCQLLSANFNRETPYSPPSASMSVRVPPRNVSVFLTGLAQHGEVLSHSRDSEDKTNQVVDTEARIKNLTELRDRLRVMLTDKTAKFKDLIEVQRELANTQSELDSITSYRKVLALETDWVAVDIAFSAKQGVTEQGFFAPVALAIKNAGRVMMESLAAVITFVVAVIPWLLIVVPLLVVLRKLWVKFRAKTL